MKKFQLKDYALKLGSELLQSHIADQAQEISLVTNKSKEALAGTIFCAIAGAKTDGHKYIDDAIKNGASVIIHSALNEDSYKENISYLKVRDSYKAYALAVELFYGNPASGMKLGAVTGTNGKTTTAYILRALIESAHPGKCGFISTVEYALGDGLAIEAERTTPEAAELQSFFHRMLKNGCSHMVMEQSSHGLSQGRSGAAKFDAAIFTNLTGDHLDYHKTMEAYYQAKKLLFTEHLKASGTAVINIDDPYGRRLAKELAGKTKIVSIGEAAEAELRISDMKIELSGTSFTLTVHGESLKIKSRLIGAHNIHNLTCALAASEAMGISFDDALKCIKDHEIRVPGRLEAFKTNAGAYVFVDYAHTDDALERVLEALRKLNPRSIITLFGCGGDRDKTKRPRMGRVASRLSDITIISNDNPRSEDPLAIIAEIKQGLLPGKESFEIPDRKAAIAYALSIAGNNDIVLIAGKGHENTQTFAGRVEKSDDREIVKSFIEGNLKI